MSVFIVWFAFVRSLAFGVLTGYLLTLLYSAPFLARAAWDLPPHRESVLRTGTALVVLVIATIGSYVAIGKHKRGFGIGILLFLVLGSVLTFFGPGSLPFALLRSDESVEVESVLPATLPAGLVVSLVVAGGGLGYSLARGRSRTAIAQFSSSVPVRLALFGIAVALFIGGVFSILTQSSLIVVFSALCLLAAGLLVTILLTA